MGDRVDDHRVCVTHRRTWQHPQPPQHVQNFVLRLFEESSGTREGPPVSGTTARTPRSRATPANVPLCALVT